MASNIREAQTTKTNQMAMMLVLQQELDELELEELESPC